MKRIFFIKLVLFVFRNPYTPIVFFYQTKSILYCSIFVKRRTILSLSQSDKKHRYLAYIAFSINDLSTMN